MSKNTVNYYNYFYPPTPPSNLRGHTLTYVLKRILFYLTK